MQDDYFDCFGDPAVTGKVGTDIEENKCTWLIVQALARANDEQRAVLEVGAIDLTIIVAAYFNNQFILLAGPHLIQFNLGRYISPYQVEC